MIAIEKKIPIPEKFKKTGWHQLNDALLKMRIGDSILIENSEYCICSQIRCKNKQYFADKIFKSIWEGDKKRLFRVK